MGNMRSMELMEPLLELINVNKTFKGNNKNDSVLKDISFKLYTGDCLGVLGESGSGKSTIAKIITKMITDFDSGKVIFMGQDITKVSSKDMKRVYKNMQMVFQQPTASFNPRLTLGTSIKEGLINLGVTKEKSLERMYELFETCGLKREYINRYPHEVSGGECQRGAIARAIAINPALVIFDEATSALDAPVQWQVLKLIMDLKNSKKLSYIFISHDITLIQEVCNKVIVMQNGEIVERGYTDEVIKNPQNEYTKLMIDSVLA